MFNKINKNSLTVLWVIALIITVFPFIYYIPVCHNYVPLFLKNDFTLNLLAECSGIGAGTLFTLCIIDKFYRKEKQIKWSKVENLVLKKINEIAFGFLVDLYHNFIFKGGLDNFDKGFDEKNPNSQAVKESFGKFKYYIDKYNLVPKSESSLNLKNFAECKLIQQFSSIDNDIIPYLLNYGEYTELLEKIVEIRILINEIKTSISSNNLRKEHISVLIEKLINIYDIKKPEVIKYH